LEVPVFTGGSGFTRNTKVDLAVSASALWSQPYGLLLSLVDSSHSELAVFSITLISLCDQSD
jgi:hypothetical protein